jgi:hypothetical protein
MSLAGRAFSARVQLPCRVFCGPDSILELSGTAVSIDTRSLVLAMPARSSSPEPQNQPQLGDSVRLELSLPTERQARAKCLALRARVALVTEMLDGSRHIKFTFRKVSFKDRVDKVLAKPVKSAGKLWRM